MSDAGHPSRHGYVQCRNCGTWRKSPLPVVAGSTAFECFEVDWCRAQQQRMQFRATVHAGSPTVATEVKP